MKKPRRKRPRKYTGTLQYFHNFEHDPRGRTHCKSSGKHPYTIRHRDGKHIISHPIAQGHGRGGKPQLFRFPKRLRDGFDMSKGIQITPKPPKLR